MPSFVYDANFFIEGKLDQDHPDWNSCAGEKVENLSLSHNFRLDTATGTPKERLHEEYLNTFFWHLEVDQCWRGIIIFITVTEYGQIIQFYSKVFIKVFLTVHQLYSRVQGLPGLHLLR